MVTEDTKDVSKDLIQFRLDSIDEQLKQMQDIIKNNILQDRDIKDLNQRMLLAESEIACIKANVAKLANQPTVEKAERWKYITDYIFKILVAASVAGLAYKIGVSI